MQPDQVEHSRDDRLSQLLPDDLPVTYSPALPLQVTRKFGLGNLGLRCLPALARLGDRLLASQRFDLVFFSSTIFPVMILGDRWQRRFRVPYILDFQDPWRVEAAPTHQRPGGRLRYAVDKFLAKNLEPRAVKRVSHIISVSPVYPAQLQKRYPWLQPEQFTVLPFGAPEQDFAQLPALGIQQSIFDSNDGNRHWVYVGRGGSDMTFALRSLFLAIRTGRDRQPQLWNTVRLHFVGTSYATGTRASKTVEAIAQECGIADLVTEHSHRIPYFEAQQVLRDSDAILLVGSEDPAYTASKLYPGILAKKPILAIFHQQSSVVSILRECNAGQVITFQTSDAPADLQPALTASLNELIQHEKGFQPNTNWSAFQPYTAREMTRRMCELFDRCLRES
ncbi:glycosyltransferase [Leptolyngbya ohadii]|uniref:glycosyltransferase n=1 Tax=Leptolyngbya ohadii TaxID=1962290 RepID=UPI001CEDB3A1|nr:glycosyltransferase [Leptolyngbya ohadii]